MAVFAVLMAGKAYVPIPLDHSTRALEILSQINATVVLTADSISQLATTISNDAMARDCPMQVQMLNISLDADTSYPIGVAGEESAMPLPPQASLKDLAYIIFTSVPLKSLPAM